MSTENIFPIKENPDWPPELRARATAFWRKWIGPNVVGYDQAIIDLGGLVDLAVKYGKQELGT